MTAHKQTWYTVGIMFRARRGQEDLTEIADALKGHLKTDVSNEAVEVMIENPPEKPSFPFLIFPMAVLKDILDSLDLTGIGAFFTTATSILVGALIFGWCLLHGAQGGWWKKRLIRSLWRRFFFMIILEFIPGAKIIPATSIFVYMTYNSDSKLVKIINGTLEAVHGRYTRRYRRRL